MHSLVQFSGRRAYKQKPVWQHSTVRCWQPVHSAVNDVAMWMSGISIGRRQYNSRQASLGSSDSISGTFIGKCGPKVLSPSVYILYSTVLYKDPSQSHELVGSCNPPSTTPSPYCQKSVAEDQEHKCSHIQIQTGRLGRLQCSSSHIWLPPSIFQYACRKKPTIRREAPERHMRWSPSRRTCCHQLLHPLFFFYFDTKRACEENGVGVMAAESVKFEMSFVKDQVIPQLYQIAKYLPIAIKFTFGLISIWCLLKIFNSLHI